MRAKGFILIFFVAVLITACSTKKNISETKVKVKKELSESSEQQYYYVFIEANRKKLLGDLNGALALYYQCLEINSASAAAMAEISQINTILKNYEVAIKYAKSAVQNDSENKWYKLQLAKLYLGSKKYTEAIELYEDIYKENKEDLEVPYNLAALYSHVGNPKRAIELYDEIENQTGINESLSLAKQQLYYSIGNKTKAYKEVEQLIKHYPNEPRYYGIMAEMYMSDNLFLKAEENYKKLFTLDTTNALGQLSIIDFYRKKMDYDNAFKMIKTVIRNEQIEFNQKVMVFVSIMNNQSEFGIYNEQIKESLNLLKDKYPEEKDTYTLYADYYIKMNLFDDAQKEIEHILDNYTGNTVIWEQLLSIYSYKNDFENLYIKSEVAIDSFPEHTLFYLFRGISANQIEKPTEAIEVLKNGLKKIDNNQDLEMDFYTNLGDAYNNTQEYKQSDYYFELVLKKDPDNLYIINNYSYYLSLREEKLEYAESISRKTIEAEPNNSTYLDTYAWILYKLERYQDALFYIKKAFENGGVDSEVIVEHYGDVLFKVGNIDAAVEIWKLSVEMGNDSQELKEKIENNSLNELKL
jgi:tetratricopeptide (TPR) repeat protein